jgi:hypothetical protein
MVVRACGVRASSPVHCAGETPATGSFRHTGVLARTLRRRGRQRTGSFRHTGVLARTLRRRGRQPRLCGVRASPPVHCAGEDASAPVVRHNTGVLARIMRRRGRQRTGYVAYGRPRPYIAQAGTPAHRLCGIRAPSPVHCAGGDASAPVMRRTGVLARTLRRRGRQRTGYVAYGRPRPYNHLMSVP